jgi:hypothetical protein
LFADNLRKRVKTRPGPASEKNGLFIHGVTRFEL